ncbi:MAG: RlmE family RNA methyltransferase [Planctomycetes bacterium]|nr:RlmE family RNA methyltransferase [Planctomycetota bacterium]
MKEVQDFWFRKAKEEGYRARSAYKLLAIDERFRLLKRGMRVLDAGAAPGSWTQVASKLVGERGEVVSVDLKPIDPRGLAKNVRLICGDFRTVAREEFGGTFDAIISDMAPDTSGVPIADAAISVRLCHTLLDRARDFLAVGGSLAMKVFEGGDYPELLLRAKNVFHEARGFKPASSRVESVEMFIVCTKYKGAKNDPATPTGRVKPPPAPGWKSG